MPSLATIRRHLPHYLSDEVGAVAGLSLHDLQQVVAGNLHPSREQIEKLARRMSIKTGANR